LKPLLNSSSSFDQTVHHNAYYEDPYAQEFGIRIDERLAAVEARVLPPPRVSELSSPILIASQQFPPIFVHMFLRGYCFVATEADLFTIVEFSLNTMIVAERRMSCQELVNGT
jgi:hypothetical protein